MKSNMDGTGEEILLPDESSLSPVSLTTDELTETLYWLEVTEGKLHSVSFNGYNRQIDYLGDEEFSSLTVLDRTFYFAKHQNNSFYEYSSAPLPHYTGHQDNSTSAIRHLYVYNPELLQHTYQTENPCIQSSCTGVCLIRPSSSSDLNFTCLCENFTLTDDNHWCNKDQNYSVQEDESSTTYSLQTSPAHDSGSTVELPLTTLDLVSTTGFTETTQTPDEGSSSRSSESTDTTSEKFNSPTEPNNINAAKQNTSSSSEPSLTPIAQGLDYVLIYSTVTKIKAWFLANGTHQVIQDGKETTALAGARDYIYFAGVDIHKGHIFRTSIKSGQTHEILWIDSQITSIAVDWITNNVYFTANSSLSVCSEYGEICAELICCDTDDVALAPNNQWMFYTAKMTSDDKRLIRRSGMDGSDDMVLLDESFHQFISLTVDESSGKVYWLEIEEQILHSVSFFGFGKEERLLKNENRSYRYFAVLEANFFFTMGRNGFEWQFPLWSHFWQDSSTNDVKFLHAFAPRSHNTDSATNPCEFASCPGLCLLHPGLPGFTCMCENFTLIGVNYWCTKNITSASTVHSSILIQNKNKVQFLTEQSVESVNFTLGKTPKLLDVSLAAESSPPSVVSLQKDYHLIASGVLGFILGISTASFVIVMCFVFQKCSGRRDRKRIRIQDEMEM